MAGNIWDWATQGADWWQRRDSLKDAQKDIDKGFEQGRDDVQRYTEPYFQSGLEHMGQYNDMGEFNFQFDQSDPSYQWRFGEGERAALRSQAGQKAANSGNTLTRLAEYGQGMASQEYQAEFDRDLQSYDTNKQYHQFSMEQGNNAGQMAGQYLSDMAIELQKGMNNSNFLGAAGAGDDAGMISSGIKYATESLGLDATAAAKWVADKAGIGIDAVKAVAMGAADTAAGAAWGAFGAGPQTLGASGAASGASGAGAGIGATLAAASPLLAFGGLIALDKLLDSAPKVGKSIKKIQKSSDPLATIAGMDSSDLDALFVNDEAKINIGYGVSSQQKRGTMYSLILNTLPEEQLAEVRKRSDFESMANDLFQSALSGQAIHAKLGDIGNTSSADALASLFPSIDGDKLRSMQYYAGSVRRATSYNNDYAGDFNGVTRTPQYVPTQELADLRSSLYVEFNNALDRQTAQNIANS